MRGAIIVKVINVDRFEKVMGFQAAQNANLQFKGGQIVKNLLLGQSINFLVWSHDDDFGLKV